MYTYNHVYGFVHRKLVLRSKRLAYLSENGITVNLLHTSLKKAGEGVLRGGREKKGRGEGNKGEGGGREEEGRRKRLKERRKIMSLF